MKLAPTLLSTFAVLGTCGTVCGDSVEISGGGSLNGKVTRQAEYTVIAVDDEIQVALPNSRVRRIVSSDALANYRRNAEKAGDDAELHYKLAIWCVTGNNVPGRAAYYKQFHMRRAVELNPEHAYARASLGYKKHQGKWIKSTDLMHDRGMVSVGGRWELPEAVALNESAEADEKASKLWLAEIRRLVAVVNKGSSKSGEAMETLRSIQDPMAAMAIAKQLEDSRKDRSQSAAMRRMWVDMLGRFKNGASVEALVRAGIDDPDANIREAAIKHLQEYGSSSAIATYLPMLRANNRSLVNRAAEALASFPDPELVMTYINALVTTETRQRAAGAGMNVGFGDNGANGLSTGGKPTQESVAGTNPAVLTLVKMVEPEVDFGYDEEKWRNYIASKKTRFSGDLRRDP
ncbi:hypothetical protein K227x_48550 [Rubripirellula lacrimiformis]|uniref:HEAT repeat protein n=1 Tax=Rubripirellula lacrimiformis TaxID=1930273 RepID=A0A517NH33_9BACT|nr:HEAT repeat domain-containing protein [Rubripirellula lacrimiformis]QDT06445.1 hypothetical protein K227x_48550 [Rubripirellula lacrimiformis]